MVHDRAQAVASSRCSLIRELADPGLSGRQRGALVAGRVAVDHAGLHGSRVTVSAPTLWRWLRWWRAGGVRRAGAQAAAAAQPQRPGACWTPRWRSSARRRGAAPPRSRGCPPRPGWRTVSPRTCGGCSCARAWPTRAGRRRGRWAAFKPATAGAVDPTNSSQRDAAQDSQGIPSTTLDDSPRAAAATHCPSPHQHHATARSVTLRNMQLWP